MTDSQSFRVGLVQMCSGSDLDRNLKDALDLIADAAGQGAHYIQTPEVTTLLELDKDRLHAVVTRATTDRALETFSEHAKTHSVWLHVGSMAARDQQGWLANRSYLFAPNGDLVRTYDKIHMFDVALGEGERYCESDKYKPGAKAVVAALPWGGLGLTICYDLRFPALHRTLARNGAIFLASPAAFTRTTGEVHWHTLLRARAIETQCFVFAAAQGGLHDNGRDTFGHSLVVSPWGEVLAEGGVHPSVIISDVKYAEVQDVRVRIPSLCHDRAFKIDPPAG